MIRDDIRSAMEAVLAEAGAPGCVFSLDYPPQETGADWACNAALTAAKVLKDAPQKVAERLSAALIAAHIPHVARIDVAGPGFLNIFLDDDYRAQAVADARTGDEAWGGNAMLAGQTVMVEYTDPNPFKEFHIGHLMSNAIGESVSRLLEYSGATVIRANYQGDVGPHVAKAVFGMKSGYPEYPKHFPQTENVIDFIGSSYCMGADAYEHGGEQKQKIDNLNIEIYDIVVNQKKGDQQVKALYEWGRKVTLEHFEKIYKTLGTHFDEYFFESETGPRGIAVVRAHPEIFAESDGAIVFHGEERDPKLHTRVFINKQGLPTYEAKELGLAEVKRERKTFNHSITVTAQEQEAYFKVVFAALDLVHPEWKGVFSHIHHGMMQLSSGKMSSRKGNVITGESLLSDMIAAAKEKMGERSVTNPQEVAEEIAVAAIKFSILKQGAGKNIIFDPEKSLSLEGESGPYIQYAHTRCVSVLKKAAQEGIVPSASMKGSIASAEDVLRLIPRFPDAVERAGRNEPHFVAQYLIELSSAFNAWYAAERIIGTEGAEDKLALVDAVRQTLRNGLWLLGIKAPDEM